MTDSAWPMHLQMLNDGLQVVPILLGPYMLNRIQLCFIRIVRSEENDKGDDIVEGTRVWEKPRKDEKVPARVVSGETSVEHVTLPALSHKITSCTYIAWIYNYTRTNKFKSVRSMKDSVLSIGTNFFFISRGGLICQKWNWSVRNGIRLDSKHEKDLWTYTKRFSIHFQLAIPRLTPYVSTLGFGGLYQLH